MLGNSREALWWKLAGKRDAGKMVDQGPDNRKRPAETPSPATGLERVLPKKGGVL